MTAASGAGPCALVVDETPDGWSRADDELLGTGPLDLEAAAALEPDAAAEGALLRTRGFVDGCAAGFWRTGDTAVVQVLTFADPDGATSYLLDGTDRLIAGAATLHDVAGIDGALGFRQGDPASQGAFVGYGVTFVVDAHHVLVVAGTTTGTDLTASATALAVAQGQHLLSELGQRG